MTLLTRPYSTHPWSHPHRSSSKLPRHACSLSSTFHRRTLHQRPASDRSHEFCFLATSHHIPIHSRTPIGQCHRALPASTCPCSATRLDEFVAQTRGSCFASTSLHTGIRNGRIEFHNRVCCLFDLCFLRILSHQIKWFFPFCMSGFDLHWFYWTQNRVVVKFSALWSLSNNSKCTLCLLRDTSLSLDCLLRILAQARVCFRSRVFDYFCSKWALGSKRLDENQRTLKFQQWGCFSVFLIFHLIWAILPTTWCSLNCLFRTLGSRVCTALLCMPSLFRRSSKQVAECASRRVDFRCCHGL